MEQSDCKELILHILYIYFFVFLFREVDYNNNGGNKYPNSPLEFNGKIRETIFMVKKKKEKNLLQKKIFINILDILLPNIWNLLTAKAALIMDVDQKPQRCSRYNDVF